MNENKKTELMELYANKSKHSNYQILPKSLENILSQADVDTNTRYEKERLEYILQNVDVGDKNILDIGGNTGYFSFELLDLGAKTTHLYEGNKEHCEFVKLAADVLGLKGMRVTNDYYLFKDDKEKYDIVLLLNVLHHIGDDYGDTNLTIDRAKDLILSQLNQMSRHADIVIFQLGFNWHGNRKTGLFDHGTKRELIDFIREGTASNWRVKHIGIATRTNGAIKYVDLNEDNIKRDDSLGEFLNRPLFILEAADNG